MLNVLRIAVFVPGVLDADVVDVVVSDNDEGDDDDVVVVVGEDEVGLHEFLVGEFRREDAESFETGDELILLGERIRLVNEPSLVELICAVGEGGVGKGGDDDGFVFN